MLRVTAECELIESDAASALSKLAPKSVDMAYCDPPFGNEQIWRNAAGAFSDKWRASETSTAGWQHLFAARPERAEAVKLACADEQQRAYIGSMAPIILGCYRALRPTGTLWLHFDDTMGAHLRLLCCAVFDPWLEAGTLVWRRARGSHKRSRGYPRVHDTIACYARTRAAFWRLWRLGTIGGDPLSGDWLSRFDSFAEAEPLGSTDTERVGYPTQKPIALLTELITAATQPGDLVLDPTCGSGTALVAARRLARRAIGIDMSPDAIRCARQRLMPALSPQDELFGATVADPIMSTIVPSPAPAPEMV